jgi:alpha-glucoside transport system permease protein
MTAVSKRPSDSLPEPFGNLLGEPCVVDDVGLAPRGRGQAASGAALLWLAPALLLLGLAAGWPVVWTLHTSVTEDGRFAGLDHYAVALRDPQAVTALLNTVIWAVVVPLVVTALGYLLAAVARRTREGRLLTGLLVAPVALPLLATGVAFRLLYDPNPARGTATAIVSALGGLIGVDPNAVPAWLGPQLITASLMSAFLWAWVGLAVVVFQAGLRSIPPEIEDAVRAEGGSRWDIFRTVRWPMLRRVATLVLALIGLAATRTFDLLLVMAPGSVQDEAAVLALHVWRTSYQGMPGPVAALSVMWMGVVASGLLLALLGARQEWPAPAAPSTERLTSHSDSLSRRMTVHRTRKSTAMWATLEAIARRSALGVVAVVWVVPLVMLLVTSLHSATDAAVRGWWAPLSLDSYRALFSSTVMRAALLRTAGLAATVTAVVVIVASVAAYALAWLPRLASRIAVAALLAAAVVPVHVMVEPLDEVFAPLGLPGSATALILVHVAIGVPFAALVLRNAFAAVPASQVRVARLRASNGTVLRHVVLPVSWPALVAVAALEFVLVWNDLVVGLLFNAAQVAPIGLALFEQARQFTVNAGMLCAGVVVAAVIPLLVIVLTRRWIITGIVPQLVQR